MSRTWAKIHKQAANSSNLNKLLETYPLAEALYWRLLATCTAYGRAPATAETFKVLVCPWTNISHKRIQRAIDVMEEHELIATYEIGPARYLEVVNWFKFQDFNWLYQPRPELPAPPDWQPPAELLGFIEEHNTEKNVSAERYGLETTVPTGSTHDQYPQDLDVDVDVGIDIEKASAPELKAETAKQRKQRKLEEEQQLLAEFDEEEQELLDDYMACADEGLKTGTTVGGRVARLKALITVANEVDDPDAFRYGLHQANQARAANPNYVKKAALSRRDRQ